MERKLDNVSNESAEATGWEIIVPFPGEVIGKATFSGDMSRKYQCKPPLPIKIMKSTKRLAVPGGFLYNTTTEFHKGDQVAVAEALAFVPLGKNEA